MNPQQLTFNDIESATDYYPFGQQMPGRGSNPSDYRFGYQGSEKDKEITGTACNYTTQYREVDVRIGRWWTIDPKTILTPWESPYVSMGNNPNVNIDPNGDYFFKLFGSTKEQRTAAKEFSKSKNNATIHDISKKSIHVHYQTGYSEHNQNPDVNSITMPVVVVKDNIQRFKKDGRQISPYGEINEASDLAAFEMWLDKKPDSYKDLALQVSANIAYSVVNSPSIVLTGHTFAGFQTNSDEKFKALLDVTPILLTKSIGSISNVTQSTQKGLSGFNNFIKFNPDAIFTSSNHWTINASKLYKANNIINSSLLDFDKLNSSSKIIQSTIDQTKK